MRTKTPLKLTHRSEIERGYHTLITSQTCGKCHERTDACAQLIEPRTPLYTIGGNVRVRAYAFVPSICRVFMSHIKHKYAAFPDALY